VESEHYLRLTQAVLLPELLMPSIIDRFADHLHAKCLDEPQFAHIYAKLFRQVATFERVTFGSKAFAVAFLEKVQSLHDNDDTDRAKKLANVRLVGHLFRNNAVSRNVVHTIYWKALLGQPAGHFPSQMNIEVVAQLSDVVGDLLMGDKYFDPIISHFRRWGAMKRPRYPECTMRMMKGIVNLHDTKWALRPAAPPAAAAAAAKALAPAG
jgi:hypothetical protein